MCEEEKKMQHIEDNAGENGLLDKWQRDTKVDKERERGR